MIKYELMTCNTNAVDGGVNVWEDAGSARTADVCLRLNWLTLDALGGFQLKRQFSVDLTTLLPIML